MDDRFVTDRDQLAQNGRQVVGHMHDGTVLNVGASADFYRGNIAPQHGLVAEKGAAHVELAPHRQVRW